MQVLKKPTIIETIRLNRLCWFGHVQRMEENRIPKRVLQWKQLIMITLGPALFDNNNRLITLSGGYKNLRYLTQFIVTTFDMYKKQQNLFKKLLFVCI